MGLTRAGEAIDTAHDEGARSQRVFSPFPGLVPNCADS